MNTKQSFFDLFNYSVLETEANDALYVYEDVEITRDVVIDGKRNLTREEHFDCVWFSFRHKTFHFINWDKTDQHNCTPNDNSVLFTQEELACYLYFR
jgi:hypothetical protein